jgi:peptidoglycan/LPS O-acetylase OafA/YrhL
MQRVLNLEALRGILAMYVIWAHIILMSGFLPADLGPFQFLITDEKPVDVFIIMSGFVIFLLLENRREPYKDFILRRAFRIFPAYLISLALLLPLLGPTLHALNTLPWKDTFYLKDEIWTMDISIRHLILNLLAHVTLTNGIVFSILPCSAFTLLGPAWSLSVEWQFYLLAPAIYACFRTKNRVVIALTVGLMTLLYWKFRFGEYMGFLPQKFQFFVIGILSYYVYKFRENKSAPWQLMVFLVAYSVWAGIVKGFGGVVIWFAVFAPTYFNKPILERPLLNYLGKISFSLYISHMVFVYAGIVILTMLGIKQPFTFFVALCCLTIPMIIGFSHLMFKYVEKPFMDIAKTICVPKTKLVPSES